MEGYRAEVFLHVIFVIVGLGGIFVTPMLQAVAERHSTGATRFYLAYVRRMLRIFVLPGAVIVFIVGGMLMSSDHFYGHDDPPAWLVAAIIWFVVAAVLGGIALRSTLRAAGAALEGVADSAPLPEAYRPLGVRLQVIFGLLGVSIIGIAFLMVQQPGH